MSETVETKGIEKKNLKVYDTFEDMELKKELLQGIYAYGFSGPSPIQQRAIIPISSGKDIVAQSQSGTGKTATFTIGMLQRIDESIKMPQAIITAPTKVLVKQIHKVVTEFSKFMGISVHLMQGGERRSKYSFKTESDANTAQIIVGSPGKVCETLVEKKIPLDAIKMLIVDEADDMLAMGFRDIMYNIIKSIPKEAQICLLSATIPDGMMDLTDKFMNSPITFFLKKEEVSLEGISNYILPLEKEEDKFEVLTHLYKHIGITQTVIYANKKPRVEWLAKSLNEMGFAVSHITSNMSNMEVANIMEDFRQSKSRILITTDMLSRGIDVRQVSLVINYDFPYEKETFIHRVGRSGRYGRKGTSINLITTHDLERVKEVQEYYTIKMNHLPEDIESILA